MKRILLSLIIPLFLMGVVFAQGSQNMQSSEVEKNFSVTSISSHAQNSDDEIEESDINDISNKEIEVSRNSSEMRLRARNHSVDCNGCNLTQERAENRTVVRARLSNGRNAEVKIMPDRASETALARLRLKNCNENCTIQLKEVGQGNETKLAYRLNMTKDARVLGIFKAKAKAEAEVDAETGEIILSKKPWWLAISSVKE